MQQTMSVMESEKGVTGFRETKQNLENVSPSIDKTDIMDIHYTIYIHMPSISKKNLNGRNNAFYKNIKQKNQFIHFSTV